MLDLIFEDTLNSCEFNLSCVHLRFNSITCVFIPLKFIKNFFNVILVVCFVFHWQNTSFLATLYMHYGSNNLVLIFDFSWFFRLRFFVFAHFYSFESFLLFGGFFVQNFGQFVSNEGSFCVYLALQLIQLFFFLFPQIVLLEHLRVSLIAKEAANSCTCTHL